jgi:CHAT domain-containing protein/Tfp pilus assembly protein PilF
MIYLITLIVLLAGAGTDTYSYSEVPEYLQNKNSPDSARIYNNLGIENYRSGNFELAADQFRKSLRKKREIQGSLSADMATTYSNLGAVNRKLNMSDEAMLYYDTAGYIFLNEYGSDHSWLGAVYQNQGNILREQRDINSAISYYNNALRIFLKHDRMDWVATLYNNIGIAYWRAENFEEAKRYYLLTLEIRQKNDPSSVAFPAGNLALCYEAMGEKPMADKFYLMAIDAMLQELGEDHPDIATSYMNYGSFLIKDENSRVKGYEMLHKALEIYGSFYENSGQFIARTFLNLGYYYEVTGEPQTALEYYHKSITANSETFNSDNIRDNPSTSDHTFSADFMLESLKHKAYAHLLLSGVHERKENLKASLTIYKLAMDFIEIIRCGHQTEDSRMMLSENEHQTFLQAVHVAWKLYEMTSESTYLEEAFAFSERSKAASLLSSIRDVEARSFGGVPEALLQQEQNLKKGIAAYRELIYDEQKSVNGSMEKIVLWRERVFELEMEMKKLVNRLEEEYPDYYSLKYNNQVSGINDVKKLIASGDALVSYVYSDSLIYIFTVAGKKADFHCVRHDGSVSTELEILLGVLTNGNLESRVSNDFSKFTQSARHLYGLLIEPALAGINHKKLIIIPDGILSYVPFELLVSADPGKNRNNYKTLRYLLLDFTVSYGYSATLWQESLNKLPGNGKIMLAMAPAYEYSELPTPEVLQSRQYYRDKLMPLPGAREEAVNIASMMNGEVLLDNDASEFNFKNSAGEYQLLHLAMHTLLDDDNPMFSKLVFAEPLNSNAEEDDGFLNTYEIYNLKLNANLAVLSSCRSGYGTLRRGEGVMSLARGFLYSGVPSIVMTNWEVEDKSGAEIMISFYRYLKQGYRKDEALRMARLDFLENTDMLKAHPYFWGAYVCIGNPSELFSSYRHFYPLVTFGLLLIALVIILWWSHSRRMIRK